jgi:hypothetical protein
MPGARWAAVGLLAQRASDHVETTVGLGRRDPARGDAALELPEEHGGAVDRRSPGQPLEELLPDRLLGGLGLPLRGSRKVQGGSQGGHREQELAIMHRKRGHL